MSEFIRVLGDNPEYPGTKMHHWVNRGVIQKVYPLYAVEENGELWRCTPDHEDAKVVSYRLVDMNGNSYSCADIKELKKLGIDTGKPKRQIGFIRQEDKDKEMEVDVE